jgi:hypothetical protein
LAEIKITGICDRAVFSAIVAKSASPSTSGITKSSKTKSGRLAFISRNASAP